MKCCSIKFFDVFLFWGGLKKLFWNDGNWIECISAPDQKVIKLKLKNLNMKKSFLRADAIAKSVPFQLAGLLFESRTLHITGEDCENGFEAATAQWINLRLQLFLFCVYWFESQAHHVMLFHSLFDTIVCYWSAQITN